MDAANLITISADERDCLQEITNVAMGQAADHLARLLDQFVVLSIPHVELLSPSDIAMALQSLQGTQSVSGVCQGFLGGGLAGECMLIFNDASFQDLASLFNYDTAVDKASDSGDGENIDEHTEHELLMDAANVLVGACLKGLAEQLDIEFSFGPPMLLGQHLCIDELLKNTNKLWQQALVVEINYQIEDFNVNCDLLLILTEDSIQRLLAKIACLLD